MLPIEVKDGVLSTQRFGDRINVAIPPGGCVEIRPSRNHSDVQIRTPTGAVQRNVRLVKEDA